MLIIGYLVVLDLETFDIPKNVLYMISATRGLSQGLHKRIKREALDIVSDCGIFSCEGTVSSP